jgi:hypothetical protein
MLLEGMGIWITYKETDPSVVVVERQGR